MEVLEEAVASYQTDLELVGDGVMEGLLKRGLTEQTIAGARLGFVDDPAPGHEKFQGFLAIPYLDSKGRPLTIRFRCMEEHDHRQFGHGKYMTISHDPARLFNVGAALGHGDLIGIAEGELDCLILNQIGIPAVGLPGATSWKPHYGHCLEGFGRIYSFADPDAAGAEMTNAICRSLRQAKPVKLPADVNDTYLSHGADYIKELIEQ